MKIGKFLLFILVVTAFAAGIYFKDDAIKLYQKIDIGQTIAEVGKQILTSSPLNIGGASNNVVLLQSKIIEETNFQRMLSSISPLQELKESQLLNKAAAAKAQDMFKNQYFEHVSPSGVGPGDLAQNYGYEYILVGENLILGNFSSEKELVQDWMNSPGHRANILNNRFTEIGVAIIKGTYKGDTVWIGVQEFGLPMSTCAQPSEALKNQIDLEKQQLDSFSLQIDAIGQQIDQATKKSAAYKQMIDDYNQLVNQYNSLANGLKSTIATYNAQVNTFNQCVNGL